MNAVTLVVIIILLIAFGICLVLVRRHYTKLLDVANKRAQKSQQLKSVFIDNISRTLRSPLQVIEGFCNMILDEKDENMQPAQVRESMLNISSHAQELIDFVAQLHEMSKFEGITPSFTFIEVNLSELMASYRREAMNYTKPDVSVRVTTDLSPHCKAILDTNLMHQLMMHLLTNAAAHVTRGDILVKYGAERKGLKITINFIGIGQSELVGVDIYSLLQEENALKDSVMSSALGLAISKAIVEMFGGEFYMDSDNDKTLASVWFPCQLKDTYKDLQPWGQVFGS
jgi:K+-sensing histidine kinase KdpD